MSLQVHQFQCLSDNYGFLIHDPESGDTASVDTPEAAAINNALEEKRWKLKQIFKVIPPLSMGLSRIYWMQPKPSIV